MFIHWGFGYFPSFSFPFSFVQGSCCPPILVEYYQDHEKNLMTPRSHYLSAFRCCSNYIHMPPNYFPIPTIGIMFN